MASSSLPASKLVFPDTFVPRLKYFFWRLYTPAHPYVRDLGLLLGIVSHSGRQNFLIGKIAPDESIESVTAFLVSQGYGNHFIAWKDDDEVVGLRFLKSFDYQYHIRIFKDGEVRGHYEYTPESHPILHFRAIKQENRGDEFREFLGGKVVSSAT